MVIAINIFGLIAIASSSENPEAGRIAGRQFAWLIIAGFAGQGWIKSIWEPYEKNMRHGKSLLTGLKFGSAAKATVSSERDTPQQINNYQPKAVSSFTGLKFGSSAKNNQIMKVRIIQTLRRRQNRYGLKIRRLPIKRSLLISKPH